MEDSPRSKEIDAKKRVNKELVLRALTDPEFREMLAAKPERALDQKLTPENEVEIRFVLAAVDAIEGHISLLADKLLCANGGPCGIA